VIAMLVETSPAAVAAPALKTGTNDPVERGRYTVSGDERVVWLQRVEGRVCLTDGPPEGLRGPCFAVEDNLTVMAELDAIVVDYLAQARARGGIPARVLWCRP
jgi:hypothetical protein